MRNETIYVICKKKNNSKIKKAIYVSLSSSVKYHKSEDCKILTHSDNKNVHFFPKTFKNLTIEA